MQYTAPQSIRARHLDQFAVALNSLLAPARADWQSFQPKAKQELLEAFTEDLLPFCQHPESLRHFARLFREAARLVLRYSRDPRAAEEAFSCEAANLIAELSQTQSVAPPTPQALHRLAHLLLPFVQGEIRNFCEDRVPPRYAYLPRAEDLYSESSLRSSLASYLASAASDRAGEASPREDARAALSQWRRVAANFSVLVEALEQHPPLASAFQSVQCADSILLSNPVSFAYFLRGSIAEVVKAQRELLKTVREYTPFPHAEAWRALAGLCGEGMRDEMAIDPVMTLRAEFFRAFDTYRQMLNSYSFMSKASQELGGTFQELVPPLSALTACREAFFTQTARLRRLGIDCPAEYIAELQEIARELTIGGHQHFDVVSPLLSSFPQRWRKKGDGLEISFGAGDAKRTTLRIKHSSWKFQCL